MPSKGGGGGGRHHHHHHHQQQQRRQESSGGTGHVSSHPSGHEIPLGDLQAPLMDYFLPDG